MAQIITSFPIEGDKQKSCYLSEAQLSPLSRFGHKQVCDILYLSMYTYSRGSSVVISIARKKWPQLKQVIVEIVQL